jgi:trans-2-enoyl-CoA reductase
MSHYRLLGVPPDADAAAIRAAYRELAVKLHPNSGGDVERFERLQKAYSMLSSPESRLEYDKKRDAAGIEENFAQQFRGGAFTDGLVVANENKWLAGDSFGGKGLMRQLQRNVQQIIPLKEGAQALIETSYTLSHTEGFEAWMRNHKNAGEVMTGDELVKRGMIEATGSVDTVLPDTFVQAALHKNYGPIHSVAQIDHRLKLKDRCEHGESLVHMLMAPMDWEDDMRVLDRVDALNTATPFNRKDNSWAETLMPACIGCDAVGIVIATAKHGDTGKAEDLLPKDYDRPMPGSTDFVEAKDWAIVLPDARAAPLGTWRRMLICHEDRLLFVPRDLVDLPYLAIHRSLSTAFRLLEDHGQLRPGDWIIQNVADEIVGLVVLQLCALLQISCINVIADTPRSQATKERLQATYGCAHVFLDNDQLPGLVAACAVSQPRLALDGIGGASGARLARTLMAECPLIVYDRGCYQLPQLDDAVAMENQVTTR